jgi:hypothetical protein
MRLARTGLADTTTPHGWQSVPIPLHLGELSEILYGLSFSLLNTSKTRLSAQKADTIGVRTIFRQLEMPNH